MRWVTMPTKQQRSRSAHTSNALSGSKTEKQDLMQDQKEIMAEAKGNGFNVKALRKIIADRKRDADDLAEEQAIVELYKSALGI